MGYFSPVTAQVCQQALDILRTQFSLVLVADRMKDSMALVYHLLNYGATPTHWATLSLESHVRPTLPDSLRQDIATNETLRKYAYSQNPCDYRLYLQARAMLDAHLNHFPDVVHESETALKALKKPSKTIGMRTVGVN